ncbi:class I SAM-dependent RNA methyltransferase [Aquiluna borgnonia]|uniref:Class I SAM-dependent RNA methyltransferase n=1 Tax=Aquiluna borgnonia TaxID=2499157 RepID=A0A7D4Q3K8_9MICO|nr:TRAM domain-containing protein [Aquiluna borgnonia]QKJ24869.1 class I SAM-dependent RNA methyltransferase [Aquiluna borgnonia]
MKLRVRVEKVAHGGVFVARHEGRVIFVSGAIDGELVDVEVSEDSGKFLRADVVEVLEESEHRQKHFWPAAIAGAGGAEFGHIKLSHQRTLKSQVLSEALQRMAGIEAEVEVQSCPSDLDGDGLHYRTRVQLNVDQSGTAGPFKPRTNQAVFTKTLPLAVQEIEELGLQLKNFNGVKRISIASSSTGDLQWMVDDKVNGSERLVERVGGRTFRLSSGAFWQVHKDAAGLLTAAVAKACGELGFDPTRPNLDLYAGAGLFSATLSNSYPGAQFTAVENSKQAVSDGSKSARDLTNLKFVKSDVLQYLRHLDTKPGHFDTVVLDPPRSGAANKVIEQVVKLGARNLIYVACDPVALARDLKNLVEAGYQLRGLESFDIFPHTHHFEAVAALSLG